MSTDKQSAGLTLGEGVNIKTNRGQRGRSYEHRRERPSVNRLFEVFAKIFLSSFSGFLKKPLLPTMHCFSTGRVFRYIENISTAYCTHTPSLS